jgi:hypothetical protein
VLFNHVQEKLKRAAANFRNSRAYTTNYLLSGLVVCGRCGYHYVGSAAKHGKFHYYSCQTYLKKGRDACPAKLVNKSKLEGGVLDQIQKHVLSRKNVEKYIQLVIAQASAANVMLSPEETANKLAIEDTETRLRRSEDTLERGLLSQEEAAKRIKAIRAELNAFSVSRLSWIGIAGKGENPTYSHYADGRLRPSHAGAPSLAIRRSSCASWSSRLRSIATM